MDKQVRLNGIVGITMFKDKRVVWVLLAALVIIVGLVAYIFGMNARSNNSASSTSTVQTTSSATSAKSSQKTYVEGKDYTVTYSNEGVVSKDKVDEVVKYLGLNEQKSIGLYFYGTAGGETDTEIKFYYNADDNLMEIAHIKNDEVQSVAGYDYNKKGMTDKPLGDGYLQKLPMVYDFKIK